ncbi:hypothetical protein PWT90_10923 [Aphanocladium album]|nr:hypothetical protein PWT90_10923 [Aphanocladium album]
MFGAPAQPQVRTEDLGWSVFCHVFLWTEGYEEPFQKEEAAMANPEATKSWKRLADFVMPPATAWVQERWDIQPVPRIFLVASEEEDYDSEETPESEREEQHQS